LETASKYRSLSVDIKIFSKHSDLTTASVIQRISGLSFSWYIFLFMSLVDPLLAGITASAFKIFPR
jgi:hypothetical protein